MAGVNPDVKAALIASGRWGDFVRAKTDFEASGMAACDARRSALERVAPEIAAGLPKGRRGRPTKERKEAVERACGRFVEESSAGLTPPASAASAGSEGDLRPSVGVVERGAGFPAAAPDRSFPAISRADFDGRTCSMREAVTWVLSNLCFDPATVDRSQAPSALAVTYYDACVSSPGFKADFMLKVGPMLLPKKFEEEKAGGEWEGKEEYDLLASFRGGSE